MADHVSDAADTLVEEREEVMHPPSSGNPTLRNAHFLKPVFKQHHKHLPPPPSSLLSAEKYSLRSHKGPPSSLEKLKKYRLRSYKGHSPEKWKIWVTSLKPKYQETWKQAGIFEAIMASTHTFPKDRNLILGLAERWCPETNTFIFPWGEATVTLEDVVFLGGYSVLGESFSTPLADEFLDILNCLKKVHLRSGRGHNGHVSASVWMKYYMCKGDQLEHEAFLAMWLSIFVFVCSCDHIAVQDFYVAIHLSRGTRIALAPVVLASIYRDMRLLHNSIVESVVGLKFVMHHYDLVQMWAWERFLSLRPTPGVMGKGEPRSARWNEAAILDVEDMRAALDSGKELFMWRPYSIAPSNCMLAKVYKDNEQRVVVESDDKESFARCLRVSELVGLGYIEQYLPHRVAMQFGFDQDVPPYVIRSNQTPETAWSSYNRSVRGVKLYIPPRHFESDISSRYVVWWRGLPVGNEEVNTPGCLAGCAEVRQEDVEEDSLTIAQLLSRSRKTESSGKRNGLDHEPVLNIYSITETPAKSIFMTEPVESSVRRLASSDKCKNGESPAERQKEPEARKGAEEVAINANTASELPQLGLKARIWRLEAIVEMIKAEKLVAGSREV